MDTYTPEQEIKDYIAAKQHSNVMSASAVFILILGIAVMILGYFFFPKEFAVLGWKNVNHVVGAGVLLCCVAAAITVVIKSESKLSQYEYLENGFTLSPEFRESLTKELNEYIPVCALLATAGVLLCVSGVFLFLLVSRFLIGEGVTAIGLVALLLCVGSALMILFTSNLKRKMYERLLELETYDLIRKKENQIISVTATVVWPLTVAVFFIWGLCYNGFKIAWILFPIVGVLFGAFAVICGAATQKK